MEKIYKEPNKSETETTINVLYSENMLSIYTNKVNLQKQLNKLLRPPTKEDKIKTSIAQSKNTITIRQPINPSSSPTTAKIKSVCGSEIKFPFFMEAIELLFSPFPHNCPDPMAMMEFCC